MYLLFIVYFVLLVISLALIGAALVGIMGIIARSTLMFPRDICRYGLKISASRYKFSLILTLVLFIYEAGNLTGFSWEKFEYVSKNEIIEAAILYCYPGIYSNETELRLDYSEFVPEVRYWESWDWEIENGLIEKLLGHTMYQVRLPEEIVVVSTSGKAISSTIGTCGDSLCPPKIPDQPVQGIVGIIEHEETKKGVIEISSIGWTGDDVGEVFASGNCFYAYINSKTNKELIVTPKGSNPVKISKKGFGFYSATIRGTVYSLKRISKDEFFKLKFCGKPMENI